MEVPPFPKGHIGKTPLSHESLHPTPPLSTPRDKIMPPQLNSVDLLEPTRFSLLPTRMAQYLLFREKIPKQHEGLS